MLFSFFYEIFLLLAAFVWLPKFLYQRLFKGKYKRSFWQRLGFGLPEIERTEGSLIWVHAVSVGEIKAIAPLLNLMHEKDPKTQFIISSITETGYDEALRSITFPCTHMFLPFDTGFIMRPLLKKLRPNYVLISETDFWFRFISIAKEYGATVALVNGKISEKSKERFLKVNWFSAKLFGNIDLFCVQSQEYADRFISLDVPSHQILITGNLKLDQQIHPMDEEQKKALREKLSIAPGERVIVAGSTHDQEEQAILNSMRMIWEYDPKVTLVLVPRHPERFDAVEAILQQTNVPYRRLSEAKTNEPKVILVDKMGMLTSCYQIADIAIVGGSFSPNIGGHNILEPSWYGVPVVFGPFMENQPELTDLILQANGGVQIQQLLLGVLLKALLEDNQECKRMGEAGRALTIQLKGAAERTFDALQKLRKFRIA